MAICSEADAFIAASLTQFSLTSRLAFMVVGPMVDVKLIALQAGTFSGRFAARFAPLTFVGAVVLRLTVTDTYRRYVQPGMGIWLLIAGVLVMAVGAFTLVQSLRNA